jgi:hypothetical protein
VEYVRILLAGEKGKEGKGKERKGKERKGERRSRDTHKRLLYCVKST